MTASPYHASWLCHLARVFADAQTPLYAVGGAVRNALMGLPASDVDVCGPARPEAVVQLCEGTAVTARLRAAHFGTVELHLADADGHHMAEYTTFRVDSYRGGHQPFAVRFADTPQVDDLRRDFSVNALYRPLGADPDAPADVIDPTGGLIHLRQKVLHTVTPDPDLVFQDDGLRILRAARFQAELDFTPTQALLVSARKHANLLTEIAMERLRDELARLLTSDTRYPSLCRAAAPVPAGLRTLLDVGAWPALFGALPPHPSVIAATAHYLTPADVPAVGGKLALLFAAAPPEQVAEQMHRLHFSLREIQCTTSALSAYQQISKGVCTRPEALRYGLAAVAHTVAACQALCAVGEPVGNTLQQAQALHGYLSQKSIPQSLRDLAISGDALAPLCEQANLSRKVIGTTLTTLWEMVVEGRLPNQEPALQAEAARLLVKQQGE